ncbi:MAG: S-layer homology domain-containing protein, partial [Clostridia bacterium]|nr:S-layer homology domain-containing protein [Clostridia bacterium]
ERVVKVAEVDTANKDEFAEKFLENTTSLGIDMTFYEDENIGLSANDVFTYYDALEVSDYSPETFKKAVDTSVLLAIINNSADASTVTDALKHYEDSVSLNTALTNGFTDSQKDKVSSLMMENADGLVIADAAGIAAAYAHYASKVSSESGNSGEVGPGPGFGGGAGGGAGGGGSSDDKPVTPPEEGEQTGRFTDIKEAAWAESYITYLADKGVINGKGDNKYCPNDIVSREELTKIFVEAFGFLDENATTDFSDINKDNWSYKYIASATKAGIINGVSVESFSPQGRMTRQDMAVMVYRLAKLLNVELKASEVTFADADLISDYAVEAIGALSAAGLLNGTGDNCYSPLATLTRAQAAKITYELLNAIGGIEK